MQEETKPTEEQINEINTQEEKQSENFGAENNVIEENQTEPTEIKSEISEVEKLQQEVNEQKDKYLRLFAEFDNFKKRSAKEKRENSLIAGQDIMKDLLPIIDDFKRANQSFTKDNNKESYADGLQLIFDKFIKTIQNKGLKEMESIGTDFNLERHEAIAEIPVANEEQKGKVIDEVEAGYTLNGTIIRYAKVVVGK